LGLAAVAAAVAGLAMYAVMPPNAIQIPQAATQTARLLTPEGWAFFTVSPQAVYPQAYELGPGGRWLYRGGSMAQPADLFGLNRSVRAEGTEISILLQDVPAHAWHSCGGVPVTCLSKAPVAGRLVNTFPLENLCGQVGFVRQQVLPWAWRNTGTVMPSFVLRAEVSCLSSR
jgi:antimicrobial peptide system SdpA family protein